MIKRYSRLHLSSSREILKVMLPGKYSPRALYIYKNPQPFDIQNLNKRFREEFPTAPKGEPKTRRTYDEQGNEYVWMSGDAMHFTMEYALYEQYGIKTDQNADKYPIEKNKFSEK